MQSGSRATIALLAALLLATCAGGPAREALPVLVPERFVTPESVADEIDSVATWHAPDGRVWLLATAKSGARILRYDAATGEPMGTFGAPEAVLQRPNGIAVVGDVAFVADQRARHVLLLGLPDGVPLGTVGEGVLRNPYGLWVQPLGGQEYSVLVTDSYRLAGGAMPPHDELGERIRRFRVRIGESVHWQADAAFGETRGEGVLLTVESIAGDPVHARLLVAEEERDAPSGLRVYGMDGRYSGHSLAAGIFAHQAEGIALVDCEDGSGYWIASDQDPHRQRFLVFDRTSLDPLGAFRGALARDTDGLAFERGPLSGFPHGALYAQHDNRAVVAFDWGEIAATLGLRADCD